MEIRIGSDFDGASVKDWLYQNGISRGLITQLKKLPDGITVNGEHATVRRILLAGDVLALALDDRAEDVNMQLVPTEMPLDIIYEDDDMIALNKPYGMPTHPSHGHFCDTLANGVCYYFFSRGIPFVFRAINRLDRDTGGIVLMAKNRASAARLTELMQAGRIKKTYIAVLNGRLMPPDGSIDASVRRKADSIMLREVCAPDASGARHALTVYETVVSSADVTVVRASPITGRTHQLRVHFASRGCPIVGDGLYGTAETAPTVWDAMMTRQALHAASLVIEADSGTITLNADPADDMCRLIERIKGADTDL